MRVKVRKVSVDDPLWGKLKLAERPQMIRILPTKTIERMVRYDAEGRQTLPPQDLFFLLDELIRRKEIRSKAAVAAWEEFRQYYMPRSEDPHIPHKLTPSHQGRECLGNGSWPGYECCCDECNWFLECFPEQAV